MSNVNTPDLPAAPARLPDDVPGVHRLEDLPLRYTERYSARDFTAWRQLFADHAVVIRLDAQGGAQRMAIDDAVRAYARHGEAVHWQHETWDEVSIRQEGRLAHVRARYCLRSDRDWREGIDLLTLARTGDRWRIVCLAYEQTRHRPAHVLCAPRPPTGTPLPVAGANLADGLTVQAARRPEAVALEWTGRTLNFAALEHAVWQTVRRLAAHGAGRGHVVALDIGEDALAVVAMLAVARLGATVHWRPGGAGPLRPQALRACGATLLVGNARTPAAAGLALLRLDLGELQADRTAVDPALRDPDPQAPWTVLTGSGSTGRPKQLPVHHRQFLAQGRAYADALGLHPDDRVASLMTLDSVVKRERFLDAVLAGACVVLADQPATDPMVWLGARGITVFWSIVPHAERLLSLRAGAPRPALPALRAFIVGSSTVSESLRVRVLRHLTPALHVYYGTNEIGLATLARPADLLASPQTVGHAGPGVTLSIVDERGQALPAGQIGRIRLRGPGLIDGYADDAEATRRAFRDGAFEPGDLGRVTEDGRLDFCGRADLMLVVDGVNVYPEEIERVLHAHPAVADAAVLPVRHPVHQDLPVAAVALHPGGDADADALRQHASERLGPRGPRRIVVLATIPRNPQGKLDRAALAAQLDAALQGWAGAPVDTRTAAPAPAPFGSPRSLAPRNLSSDLLHHAAFSPEAPALLLPGGEVFGYRTLNEAVWRFTGWLHRQGVRAGQVVGLTLDDAPALVLTLLALARLGATAFSVPRSATPAQRREMMAQAGVRWLATDRAEDARDPAGAAPLPPVHRAAILADPAPVDHGLLDPHPAAPWLLITGSGSTGTPKLIPVTHGQMAARARAAQALLRLRAADRTASLSHFDFATSKFRLFEALAAGAACGLPDWGPDTVAQVRRMGLSVLHATVFHVETLLAARRPHEPPPLAGLRVLEVTASTVTDELRRRVYEGLCPQLYVRYGINEAGPVAIAGPPEVYDVPGTVGRAAPGITLEVVDADHRPLPPGETGRVRLRGPGVVDGYPADPAATARAFRDGWFLPGDLGCLRPDGQLIFRGRADDLMIFNGMNLYPVEIEQVLAAQPEVHDVAVLPMRHRVHQDLPVAAIVLEPGARVTLQTLMDRVAAVLGARSPRVLVRLPHIARNREGKLDRAALRAAVTARLPPEAADTAPP